MSGAPPPSAADAAVGAPPARPFTSKTALALMAGIAVGLLAGQALMRAAHGYLSSSSSAL